MYRSDCSDCKNQDIKVSVVYKKPSVDPSEAVAMLKNLKLLTTLQNTMDITEETHDFLVEPDSPTFFLVFLSAGSCTQIKYIDVFYLVCERNTSSGIDLPQTDAPAHGFQRVNVSCPVNTLNPGNDQAYGLCSSEGKWDIISPCMCKKGYTLRTVAEGCMGKLELT